MKEESNSRIKSFWNKIGYSLSSFYDAPSTRYYLECDKIIFDKHFPDLKGKKIFKTDLWDEAKNSRVGLWLAKQGAQVYGIDISRSILDEARLLFKKNRLEQRFAVSDLRQIPFADESFDGLYSMGTIEHFPEYKTAVAECFRVLRRGGKAIIGVPNKHDPFLRPIMVAALNKIKLYPYGFEKSFTMQELSEMLEEEGFQVVEKTGVLFMPGLLRMIDIYLYIKRSRLTLLTSPFVAFFSFLYKNFPIFRRNSYLIACVVQKP